MSGSQITPIPKSPPAVGFASADGMVIVEIGPEKAKHHVHKALLVHHSGYFAKALIGPWSEAEERRVTLDDVDTDAFNLFVHWLYAQQLPHDDPSFRAVVKGPAAGPADYVDNGLILLRAYALGDRLLATDFRREVNNTYINLHKFFSSKPSSILPRIVYAFERIPQGRVILHFLVNDFCLRFDPDTIHASDWSALLDFPPAFTARVIRRFSYCGRVKKHTSCYLEHATEQSKQACKKTHISLAGEGAEYGFLGKPRFN